MKKNIIYRLYVDVSYIEHNPETYSGITLDINSFNEKKTIIFQKKLITLDSIDMIKYAYKNIGLSNIETVVYKDNYNNYLNDSKKFYEKVYKGSFFKIPLPKNIKNKIDIKMFYFSNNNSNQTQSKILNFK